MQEIPHVAVVVLSWNGRADTLACLDSLAGVEWESLTTVVVDNGSTDGTSEAVSARFPRVEVVRSEENLGFAEGNNLGLRRALELGAEYVLMLNNDTFVDPRVVERLVEEARRREDAGALCPLVYHAEPTDLLWYAGGRFDPRRGHNGRQDGYRERDVGQFGKVREVGRATGAAMMVPRPVFERVGLLDGDLFLHVEDTEWSLRARKAGYRIYVVPEAKVWHKVSAATGGECSPTIAYYAMRNTLEVCARHAPMRGPRGLVRHAETVAANLLHARRAPQRLDAVRAVVEGWRDYRRGRLGPRGRTVPRRRDPVAGGR